MHISFQVVGVCQATKPSAQTHNNGGVWLYDGKERFSGRPTRAKNGGVWLYNGVEIFLGRPTKAERFLGTPTRAEKDLILQCLKVIQLFHKGNSL